MFYFHCVLDCFWTYFLEQPKGERREQILTLQTSSSSTLHCVLYCQLYIVYVLSLYCQYYIDIVLSMLRKSFNIMKMNFNEMKISVNIKKYKKMYFNILRVYLKTNMVYCQQWVSLYCQILVNNAFSLSCIYILLPKLYFHYF